MTARRDPAPIPPPLSPPTLSVIIPCYDERANVAPLIARLDRALAALSWEAIFVDDDSPDGTAEALRAAGATDRRIRCLRRIGRRGLASAVIEGALASSASYVAVIDADLQHDETRLPAMLETLLAGHCDIVVGSRHLAGGDDAGLGTSFRHRLSELGTRLAQHFLPVRLTDPMSGYFMLPRALFERLAPDLTGQGFKILLDLLLAAPPGLRVTEIPVIFRARQAGESKLDALVLAQFATLLVDKSLHGMVPIRFLAFACIGALGLVVHLAVLLAARRAGLAFTDAQTAATLTAMVANFQLNNVITYRDQRLRGAALWQGLALFMAVCGLGAVANIGIADVLYAGHTRWPVAGAAGALIGLVWNYAVSSTLVWRRK